MSERRDRQVSRQMEHYGHWRRAITEFVEHYHLERNHQGLDKQLITRTPVADAPGCVRRRSRLGGLLNY
jgi:hypothetical protein